MESPSAHAGTAAKASAAADGQPGSTDRAVVASQLRLAIGRLARQLRAQNLGGLTLSQWSALVTIEQHGATRIGEVADRENVSAPTATRLVASLEESGLLRRTADPSDRRSSWVEVSPEGVEKLEWMRGTQAATLTRRLARLDDDELQQIADVIPLLERLIVED